MKSLVVKPLFIFLFLLAARVGTYAQHQPAAADSPKADSAKQITDSLHNQLLMTQSSQLQELEARRKADSVRQTELEQQLNSLRTTDNAKRQAVQTELSELKDRESERLRQRKRKIDSLRAFVKGFPVAPFSDTLFFIYTRLGSFSPRERASAIDSKIRKLAEDYLYKPDSLLVEQGEQVMDIIYGDKVIASVTENDALWMNAGSDSLAGIYRARMNQAILDYKKATSLQTLLKDVGLALLVIIILGAIIYFINRFFRIIKIRLSRQEDKRIKGIRIRDYQLFNSRQEVRLFMVITNFVKWIFILIVIYLTLPILFGIFPWTKQLASTLLGFFLGPLSRIIAALWAYMPKLFTIIVIVLLFRYFLKGLAFLRNEVEKGSLRIPGFYPDWANPTFQIVRVLSLAFMLIVIFPYLPGSESPIFKGVSVFLGVLFTFGSAGALGNIVAGLVLTYMRAFKTGDRVRIGEVTGDIMERTLLVTRIRTIKNEIISIPNSMVMSNHTINFSSDAAEKGLILHTTVTIGYDVPWRQVHDLLINAALATDGVEKEPRPFVYQTDLGDYNVAYQINAYTKLPNRQSDTYSRLRQNIQDGFNEAGVEIMSPQYTAVRDGNNVTIPPDYLPDDYYSPAFKVQQHPPGSQQPNRSESGKRPPDLRDPPAADKPPQ